MKKSNTLRIIAAGLLFGFTLGTTAPLLADETSQNTAIKDEEKKPTEFGGKIEALNLKAKTVTVDKTEILVVDKTKITKNNMPIELDDLKVGEEVHGTMQLNADKKNEAILLNVGPKKNETPQPYEVK